MANNKLAETFLKDLEDLEEEDSNVKNQPHIEEEKSDNHQAAIINEIMMEFPKFNKDNNGLLFDPQFIEHMKEVDHFSSMLIKDYKKKIEYGDTEYILIQNCNKYSNLIDKEIVLVHKYVRDLYYKKFPELESIVFNPIDYVKCVQKIQNETDLNNVDLQNILTNHQIVAINVAGSSAAGNILSPFELNNVLNSCNIVLTLDDSKKKILSYVESRMQYIAPNLSAIIGTSVAAQLMAAAGGLDALARMPACNIQVIGSQRKNMLGLSKAGAKSHQGFFGNLDMVKKSPAQFQVKLIRMLSTNCAKAARIDNLGMCHDGTLGEKIKEDMLKRFMKIQEPPPAKKIKPLPIPDEKPRKKRGGKRYRSMKEKLALTEVRKFKNRMSFGPDAQKEFRETGHSFGMIGTGIGKVKLQQKNQKINLSKKQKVLQDKLRKPIGGESGLASSVAFTPVQGMYLANPDLLKPQTQKSEIYFNKESGFKTVLEDRKNKTNNIFEKILSLN